MARTGKRAAVVTSLVLVLAAGAFILRNLQAAENIPILGALAPDPTCSLTSLDPPRRALAERPAVAVKIENHPQGRPIAGIEQAEVVYEEPVEGGLTRFMAIYHCTDAEKAGPIRSARMVDPALLFPYTRILGDAGANDIVKEAMLEQGVVSVREEDPGGAMVRVPRTGVAFEHTLYANTTLVRRLGRNAYDEPPPADLFEFGDLEMEPAPRRASAVSMTFGAGNTVRFDWDGERWLRSDNGIPMMAETGGQVAVDNVVIEEHTFDHSKTLGDVLGTPSPEIVDVTGSGRAFLFRDGRVIRGRWERSSEGEPARFVDKQGDVMVLRPGTTWIELVPDDEGDLKGSFDVEK